MKPMLPSLKRPLPTGWSLHLHDTFAHLCVVEPHLSNAMALKLGEALSDLKAQGMLKVLLEDAIQDWKLSTSQILTLMESLRPLDCFDMRVAILSPYRDHLDDLRFLETAAVNRGYDAQAFCEVGPALSWLLQSPDQP